MDTFMLVFFGVLAVLSVSLLRTYAKFPLKELKRRGRAGDEIANALVKAVSFGQSLSLVLWLLVGLTSALFFVMIARQAPLWFAAAAIATVLWFGFVWVPATRVSYLSERFAAFIAPALAKLLQYTHPLLDRLIGLAHKIKPVHIHTGLYDKDDLIDLLEKQMVLPENRIEKTELEIARHALTFGNVLIREKMIPRRQVKMVSVHDSLGPVIMDELHASGHSRFPVYDGKQDNIVGTLFLHDLVKTKAGGTVSNNMRQEAYYLHEDQSLHDALQAVLKTHRHLFIVVNSFEEYVGIITSEDILETIVGKSIIDEFDTYDDLRLVAAREAAEEHTEHVEEITEDLDSQDTKTLGDSGDAAQDIETVEVDNT